MTTTDRTLRDVANLDTLSFDASSGLLPVVAQHATTGQVLMLAYANRAALEATLESRVVHFWSRSRQELWRKGETSGNTLRLESLHADCDSDTVLALVTPAGPACHTGDESCFGGGTRPARWEPTLTRLDATLERRAVERPDGSYTVRLLDDRNLRLKKIGEESAELVAALATGDGDGAVEEAADVVYHLLVALRAEGIGAHEVLAELEKRAG